MKKTTDEPSCDSIGLPEASCVTTIKFTALSHNTILAPPVIIKNKE